MDNNKFNTSYFSLPKEEIRKLSEEERKKEYTKQLQYIYEALKEKGYNPISQLIGFLLSEDPTYITAHKNARIIAQRLDRYEALEILLDNFLNQH